MPFLNELIHTDVYIDRLIAIISIGFGIGEAEELSKKTHVFRYICYFSIIIFITLFVQWKIRHWHSVNTKNNAFYLFWKMIYRIMTFLEQFLSSLTFNVIRIKISETQEENFLMDAGTKITLYGSMLILIIGISLFFEHYFYDIENLHKNIYTKEEKKMEKKM